jgi:hypothetical protein
MPNNESHWLAYGVYVWPVRPDGSTAGESPYVMVCIGVNGSGVGCAYRDASELARRIAALLEIYKGQSTAELEERARAVR